MDRSTFPGSLLIVFIFIHILVEQFIDFFVIFQTEGKINRLQRLVIAVLFLIVLFQFRSFFLNYVISKTQNINGIG